MITGFMGVPPAWEGHFPQGLCSLIWTGVRGMAQGFSVPLHHCIAITQTCHCLSWRQVGHSRAATAFSAGLHLSGDLYPDPMPARGPGTLQGLRKCLGNDGGASTSLCAALPPSSSHHLCVPTAFPSLSLASPVSLHLPFHPHVSSVATGPTIHLREKPRPILEEVTLPGSPVEYVKEKLREEFSRSQIQTHSWHLRVT